MKKAIVFENIYAGYGKTLILKDLSFEVPEGEVFGVIGPNGCGKTTMLNTLSGFIKPVGGTVRYYERKINQLEPHERCRMGMGRTWQIPRPFSGMTVYDNLLTAAVYGADIPKKEAAELVESILEETGLISKKEVLSGELTLLDRKRAELARAMASKPAVLLLDEAAAGLTEAESEQIMELVAKLHDKRYTILWIEHNIETMLNATDRLMCMAEGRNAICGDPREVMGSDIVEEIYLGADTDE